MNWSASQMDWSAKCVLLLLPFLKSLPVYHLEADVIYGGSPLVYFYQRRGSGETEDDASLTPDQSLPTYSEASTWTGGLRVFFGYRIMQYH